jgi:ABC-type transport system involved in multi-copper enzyme maturation permease subunit
MMRALVLRGLRLHAGLLLVLSLGLLLFEWAIVWVAARIGLGPSFQQMLTTLLPPDVVETIFSQFGFASFRGAMSFGYQHPLALVAGIAMVTVMATLPADERESGLLDLVLSRPLPRPRYLAANGLLVVLAAVLCPLALLAGGALGIAVVEAPEVVAWTAYLPPAGALVLLLLAVGAYTLLFASGARRRGVAVAQGVGASLLFYWLDFMGEYWDLLEKPRILSPFYYFDPALAANEGIPLAHVTVLAGVTVLATVGAFVRFGRQDL